MPKRSDWQHLDLYELMTAVGADLKPTSYLEIGVDTGESAWALLSGHPGVGELILCDTWERQPAHTHDHVQKRFAGYEGGVTFLDGRSQDLVPSFLKDRMVDLAFVDGDHTYKAALTDIANVWPNVSQAMIVHDIEFPDVWRAFYEFCCKEKPREVICAFAGHGAGVVLK